MMDEVTSILSAIEQGHPWAAERLLPLGYDELRRLAAQRLAHEKPGQTLQPTALVHEAYLRLVGSGTPARWDGCGHFFAAAAESMRRILVEQARRKRSHKHGGGQRREPADLDALLAGGYAREVLALHEALEQLAAHYPKKVKLVEMRFFARLTLEPAAECLGISPRTADRAWRYARAGLYSAMAGPDSGENEGLVAASTLRRRIEGW
jgi:RNA polymerase sigma factor (TIGR02999 family)